MMLGRHLTDRGMVRSSEARIARKAVSMFRKTFHILEARQDQDAISGVFLTDRCNIFDIRDRVGGRRDCPRLIAIFREGQGREPDRVETNDMIRQRADGFGHGQRHQASSVGDKGNGFHGPTTPLDAKSSSWAGNRSALPAFEDLTTMEQVMKNPKPSPVVLIGAAVVMILIGVLATLIWQEAQSDTVEIQFGDGEIRFETGGLGYN